MVSFPRFDKLQRHVAGTVMVCLAVGIVLYLMRGRHFWIGMLYAFTIGTQISLLISGYLHLVAAWQLRRRPGDAALQAGWVGWPWVVPGVLLGSVAGYVGGTWLGDVLLGRRSIYLWEQSAFASLFSLVFTLMVSVIATAYFFSHFKLQSAKVAQAEAQRLASEARLTLLQSQLEPHMLFNTLAHLRVLIKLRPDEAQAMLDQLIAYLRATLQASRAASHPLADEFARLSDYLALMQVRMGERLRVTLELPSELAALPIPPLLLQPLVENAIKHGLEPHLCGGLLSVRASHVAGRLRLEVSDTGAGLGPPLQGAAPVDGTGFGLAQVRERLSQRFGGAARFELSARPGGGSTALIELPLEHA